MKVTAALAWWNERPEDLADCVRSMANIADAVYALDGSYARYPGATIQSPPEQADAIRQTAKEIGLPCRVVLNTELWPGQVAKRTFMLGHAIEGSDWVAVVDADHIIRAERDSAREALEAVGDDTAVIEVPFYTPRHPERSVLDSSPGYWHAAHADTLVTYPHLYRALPGLRVEQRHWWMAAGRGEDSVWLWGGDGGRPLLTHGVFGPEVYIVEHRTLMRTKEQILASRAFLNDRQTVVMPLTGQEDDRPDLPRPVFDFDARPAY